MTGKEFKIARDCLRYSQNDLASIMSVTRVTISRWENSDKVPKSQANAIKQMLHEQQNVTHNIHEQPKNKIEIDDMNNNKDELKLNLEKLLNKINKKITQLENEGNDVEAFKELNGLILLKDEIKNKLEFI